MLCERCHVRPAGFGYDTCLTCEVDEKEAHWVRATGKPSEMWRFHGVPMTRAQRAIAEREESEYIADMQQWERPE